MFLLGGSDISSGTVSWSTYMNPHKSMIHLLLYINTVVL